MLIKSNSIKLINTLIAEDKNIILSFDVTNDLIAHQAIIKNNDQEITIDIKNKGIYQVFLNNFKEVEIFSNYLNEYQNFDLRFNNPKIFVLENYLFKYLETNLVFKEVSFDEYYNQTVIKSNELTNLYRNVFNNAKIYYQTKNRQLLEKIKNDLLFLNKFYNSSIDYPQNWWDYEIGIPKTLLKTLVVLYNDLDMNFIYQQLFNIKRFTNDSKILHYDWSIRPSIKASTANYADLIEIILWSNIIMENDNNITDEYNNFQELFKYTNSKNGFYLDGSYIEHEKIAYTGGYGEVWLSSVKDLLNLFSSLGFDLEKELNFTKNVLIESFFPLMFDGLMNDSTRGRAISREKIDNEFIYNKISNAILEIINLFNYDDQNTIAEKLNLVSKNPKIKNRILETKAFNKMSQYVYKTNDLMMGISLLNNNLLTHEFMNGENKKGWYYNLGYMSFYKRDNNFYNKGYFPTVNPYYLSGVTNNNQEISLNTEGLIYKNKLTNGLVYENYLFIYFDLNNPFNKLTANKSYLLDENGLIQVISNIQAVDIEDVQTTIYNFPTSFTKKTVLEVKSNEKIITIIKDNNGSFKDINDFENDQILKKQYEIKYIKHQKLVSWYKFGLSNNDLKIDEDNKDLHILENNNLFFVNKYNNENINFLSLTSNNIGSFIYDNRANIKRIIYNSDFKFDLKDVKIIKELFDNNQRIIEFKEI